MEVQKDQGKEENKDLDGGPDGADVAPLPVIENLVFRGGGVKGIAYCGALKVLTDVHLLDHVKRH